MPTHGRFLTTHVGSLPRPDDVVAMMWAREDGMPVDTAALEERVCTAAIPELVAQRIGRYVGLVGRDNVMAGVDCGFSIHVGSGGVDPEVVWAKLGSLSQGAAIASRKFWP